AKPLEVFLRALNLKGLLSPMDRTTRLQHGRLLWGRAAHRLPPQRTPMQTVPASDSEHDSTPIAIKVMCESFAAERADRATKGEMDIKEVLRCNDQYSRERTE
ncbi:unnamed protein product, partial [Prorocentrum cordatum]